MVSMNTVKPYYVLTAMAISINQNFPSQMTPLESLFSDSSNFSGLQV